MAEQPTKSRGHRKSQLDKVEGDKEEMTASKMFKMKQKSDINWNLLEVVEFATYPEVRHECRQKF